MSRKELLERFSLERVVPSPATFDYKKLDWMNGMYLRDLQPDEYALDLIRWLREQGVDWPAERVRATVPLVQEKIEKFSAYPDFVRFLFQPIEPPAGLDAELLHAAHDRLASVEPWEAGAIDEALRALADELGQKPRQAFVPIRLAVTGAKVSPGLFESLELLGKEEALKRLSAAAAAPAA
jgi:glutamyl-tRNA synthetase